MQKRGEKAAAHGVAAGKEMADAVLEKAKEVQKRGEKAAAHGTAAAKNVSGMTERDLSLLERLHDLQQNGVITDEEFQEQKRKILDRI